MRRRQRRLRLEPLEDRWLLALGCGADGDAGVGLFGEGEPGSPTPAVPDLLGINDTGVSNSDNITRRDNSAPEKILRFAVGGTVAGAAVTVYADGVAIGSATAGDATTLVPTDGVHDLADGLRTITARQTVPGEDESPDSAALTITIDTETPGIVEAVWVGGYDTGGAIDFTRRVTVVENRVYMAAGIAGLQIVDASNPAAPSPIGEYDFGDQTMDVAVVGDLAYVTVASAGFHILDVGDPVHPEWVGSYDTTGSAMGVTIVGNRAYVADDNAGLQIIDISNPAVPVRLGGYNTKGYAMEVRVEGNLAYVADGHAGLQIIDVTDPTNPVWVGEYDSTSSTNDMIVEGSLAYLADGYNDLQIIDVSDPAHPTWVGECILVGGNESYGLTLAGNRAYVVNGSTGLQIVDVTDPTSPLWLGGCNDFPPGDCTLDVVVEGNLAYVADYNAGLQIVDIGPTLSRSMPDLQTASDTGASDTDNITAIRTPTFDVSVPSGYYFRFYRDGEQISDDYETGDSFTASFQQDGVYDYTFTLVDTAGNISAPSAPLSVTIDNTCPPIVEPTWLGEYNTGGTAEGIALEGNMVYLVDENAGLQIIDVTDPAEPAWLGEYDTNDNAYDVTVVGNLAYVADEDAGLQIIDVTDPADPVWLGEYDTDGNAYGVTVVGNLAYVADDDAGLQIINVTDPADPVWLGEYNTNGYAEGVTVVENLAYVADGYDGLQIIDVNDPAHPAWVGGCETSSYARDVVAAGNFAYVADGYDGLQIIDVTDPADPRRRGHYTSYDGNFSYAVALVGNLAFLADGGAGLRVIDVTDPVRPVWLGGYDTPGRAEDVVVAGNLAYVADGEAGLQIIDIGPTYSLPVPDLQGASDTGTSNTDDVTADKTPTFDVSVPEGLYFRFYRDGEQISGDYETGDSFTAPLQPVGVYDYTFTLVDAAGNVSAHSAPLTVTIVQPAVVDRHVFYPGSAWGAATAPDKEALVPGTEPITATFANLTSHPAGIRGVYIDIADLPATPTIDDFEFRVGNHDIPADWPLALAPTGILTIPGGGTDDSERIALVWAVNAIKNTWLQVTVKATEHTGLLQDDVLYFGNAVGDVGDESSLGFVTAADLVAIRNHPRGDSNPATIDDRYDLNKDTSVNAIDLILARNSVGSPLDALRMITPPVPAPPVIPGEALSGEQRTPLDALDTASSLTKRPADADPLLIDLLLGESNRRDGAAV